MRVSRSIPGVAAVSVFFRDTRMRRCRMTAEEAGAAVARVAKERLRCTIDCRRKRFSAGSFFLSGQPVPLADVRNAYVRGEHAFATMSRVRAFLRTVRRNPSVTRFVHFVPGAHRNADVVVLVVSADQASRLLGLAAHARSIRMECIPASPTCAVIFRPLLFPDRIHLHFIDYFDRDFEAKGLFAEGELLLGMRPAVFRRICRAYPRSAHGTFLPAGLPVYRSRVKE